MTSTTGSELPRLCPVDGKVPFASRLDANTKLLRLWAAGNKKWPKGTYYSPDCGYWHLTSEWQNKYRKPRSR